MNFKEKPKQIADSLAFNFMMVSVFLAFLPGISFGKEPLPREIAGLSLLMPYKTFKVTIKELGYKIGKEEKGVDPPSGLPFHLVILKHPTRGAHDYRILVYFNEEGRIEQIYEETFRVKSEEEFNAFFSGLKSKYGKPDRVEGGGFDLLNIKDLQYYWSDDRTEMQTGFSPPGKDPFGRPASGTFTWIITDKAQLEKNRQMDQRNQPPKRKKD